MDIKIKDKTSKWLPCDLKIGQVFKLIVNGEGKPGNEAYIVVGDTNYTGLGFCKIVRLSDGISTPFNVFFAKTSHQFGFRLVQNVELVGEI